MRLLLKLESEMLLKGDRFFCLTAKPGLAEPARQIWEKIRR
jgi:hypothetical protein